MTFNKHLDLPEAGEGTRHDEIYADAIDLNKSTERIGESTRDERTKTEHGDKEHTRASEELAKREEQWLEAVKAFIRQIDVDSL